MGPIALPYHLCKITSRPVPTKEDTMQKGNIDLSNLGKPGYAKLTYLDLLRQGVRSATNAWRKFFALDEELKRLISYSGDVNVSGVGYELKLEPGSNNDLKEDFHLRTSKRDFLMKEVEKIGQEDKEAGHTAEEFVHAALFLNHLAEPVIQEFAAAAEEQFGIDGLLVDTIAKQPEALIRFLHYFGNRGDGDELAAQHVDKGGFTLHLFESDLGLEYLGHNRAWQPMEFELGEAAVIPGMRLQLRSRNQLKATCHRVIANAKTAVRGRCSAVIFVDFANTPYYNKEKFGRLQDQLAGFNYNMPLPEFEKLFKN